MRAQIAAIRQSGFIRSAGLLVGGTAIAQALTVLALPLLTRLYTPEEFSLLAVFVAMLTLLSVIACLRFEIAIPLPEDDAEAANLLALSLLLATAVAIGVGGAVLVFGAAFFAAIGHPAMTPYGWLLPPAVWFAGCYAALQYWATRKKRFSTIASTRMVQAGSGLTAQLGLGWLGAGPVGLMLGQALLSGSGALNLLRQVAAQDMGALRAISRQGMYRAFSDFRRFPQYSTWEALTNNAAIQVPVLLIASLALGPEAGFVLLATKAMGTPVNMLGGAVSQVYLSRAPEEMRRGRLPEFTVQVLRGLARTGVGPMAFLAVIAPVAFSQIFGEEWRRAGELVAWMMPWFVLKLLSSPVAMVMHVRMKQRTMLVLMLVGLIVRLAMTLGAYSIDSAYIAEGYAVSGMVFYLSALLVYLSVAGAGMRGVLDLGRTILIPSAVAVAAGLVILELLQSMGFS